MVDTLIEVVTTNVVFAFIYSEVRIKICMVRIAESMAYI